MKLNSKNIFARYYNWIYDEFPQDVCTFFWATLFALIFTVFVIPGRLLSESYDPFSKKFGHGFLFWIVALWVTILGMLPYSLFDKEWFKSLNLFVALLLGLITGIIMVLIVVALVMGIKWILETSHDKIVYSSDESVYHKTRHFIDAVRGKYCTKIEWVKK